MINCGGYCFPVLLLPPSSKIPHLGSKFCRVSYAGGPRKLVWESGVADARGMRRGLQPVPAATSDPEKAGELGGDAAARARSTSVAPAAVPVPVGTQVVPAAPRMMRMAEATIRWSYRSSGRLVWAY